MTIMGFFTGYGRTKQLALSSSPLRQLAARVTAAAVTQQRALEETAAAALKRKKKRKKR